MGVERCAASAKLIQTTAELNIICVAEFTNTKIFVIFVDHENPEQIDKSYMIENYTLKLIIHIWNDGLRYNEHINLLLENRVVQNILSNGTIMLAIFN